MMYNVKNKRETNKDIGRIRNRPSGLGHQVQESWPYLSNVAPLPHELSHVKNEFSLVELTARQWENGQSERESVPKQWLGLDLIKQNSTQG